MRITDHIHAGPATACVPFASCNRCAADTTYRTIQLWEGMSIKLHRYFLGCIQCIPKQ